MFKTIICSHLSPVCWRRWAAEHLWALSLSAVWPVHCETPSAGLGDSCQSQTPPLGDRTNDQLQSYTLIKEQEMWLCEFHYEQSHSEEAAALRVTLCVQIVVFPEWAEFMLATHIPNGEFQVFVFNSFDIKTWNRYRIRYYLNTVACLHVCTFISITKGYLWSVWAA